MRRVALDAGIDFPAAAKVTRFAATKVARSTRVQPKNAPKNRTIKLTIIFDSISPL